MRTVGGLCWSLNDIVTEPDLSDYEVLFHYDYYMILGNEEVCFLKKEEQVEQKTAVMRCRGKYVKEQKVRFL